MANVDMDVLDIFVAIRGKPNTRRQLGFIEDSVIVTVGRKSTTVPDVKGAFKDSKSPLTDLSQSRTYSFKSSDVRTTPLSDLSSLLQYLSVTSDTGVKKYLNPDQRPIDLVATLIKVFAKPGQNVISIGSGALTEMRACMQLCPGVSTINFDKDKEQNFEAFKVCENMAKAMKQSAPEGEEEVKATPLAKEKKGGRHQAKKVKKEKHSRLVEEGEKEAEEEEDENEEAEVKGQGEEEEEHSEASDGESSELMSDFNSRSDSEDSRPRPRKRQASPPPPPSSPPLV